MYSWDTQVFKSCITLALLHVEKMHIMLQSALQYKADQKTSLLQVNLDLMRSDQYLMSVVAKHICCNRCIYTGSETFK
jgi:hypothetical protein